VDDDRDTRLLYRTFLSMEGFEAIDLGDAESALRELAEVAPDVVITDLVLPGKSGLELAAAIRERDPERRITVIAVTGRASAPKDFQPAGDPFDVVLVKPCPLEHLLEAIHRPPGRLSSPPADRC
jgi:DNA-binding response OmpR family regulator